MRAWTLWQFKTIVDSFLAGCCQAMQEKFEQRLDLLSQRGNECRRPVTEYLGDGLFELRARAGKEQARLIFYYAMNRRIIFIHAFYKPGNKIDPKELIIANKNRKKIQDGTEEEHALNFVN